MYKNIEIFALKEEKQDKQDGTLWRNSKTRTKLKPRMDLCVVTIYRRAPLLRHRIFIHVSAICRVVYSFLSPPKGNNDKTPTVFVNFLRTLLSLMFFGTITHYRNKSSRYQIVLEIIKNKKCIRKRNFKQQCKCLRSLLCLCQITIIIRISRKYAILK